MDKGYLPFYFLEYFTSRDTYMGYCVQYLCTFRDIGHLGKLTLNAPIATKGVCFSRLLKCLRSLYGKLCGPRSDCSYAVCSGSTLFASILNSSVMIGNYLQQTTSADEIFRCIFFLGALRVNYGDICQFIRNTCLFTRTFKGYGIFGTIPPYTSLGTSDCQVHR